MTKLKYFKTHPDIKDPAFATEQSACFDLSFSSAGKTQYTGYNQYNKTFIRPLTNGNIYLAPHDRALVPTGLIFDIPEGYSVRLHARSGLSLRQGLVLANSEGVIDSDYIHEVFAIIYNRSENGMNIANGDRICQGEMIKTVTYSLAQIDKAPTIKTNREGGMGSTGVNDAQGT